MFYVCCKCFNVYNTITEALLESFDPGVDLVDPLQAVCVTSKVNPRKSNTYC